MQADIRWLDQPEVFRVNRLDAHSDHRFFENEQTYQKKEERRNTSTVFKWNLEISLFRKCERTSKRIL